MWKYISDIIDTTTTSKKIFSLFLILLTISFLAVTPFLPQIFEKDNEELMKMIDSKDVIIDTMRVQLINYNLKLLNNEKKCTDEIIRIERENREKIIAAEKNILSKINYILDDIENVQYYYERKLKNAQRSDYIIIQDTMNSGQVNQSAPRIIEEDNNDIKLVTDDISTKLKSLKNQINSDINKIKKND